MKIYVGNLAKQVNDSDLNALALPFGKPESAHIARELAGTSKGFGFVEFAADDEARAAITGLDGKHVHGWALKVHEANAPTRGGQFATDLRR